MTAYGNRGMSFEDYIKYANEQYKRSGRAIIEKQNTLCKPLRDGRTGKIVSAKYEEKATVDFMGRYGARPIAFEAKHCSVDTIELKRVEEHQNDFLREWLKEPAAIGFIIISFRFLDYYLIPWEYWNAACEARRMGAGGSVIFQPYNTEWTTTGKASIRKDELPVEWKIKVQGSVSLDFLERVDALYGKYPRVSSEVAPVLK